MVGIVLVRPDDHLVLGVQWSGFTLSGSGATSRLLAGARAQVLLVLPPQHIGEETSPPGSVAPLQLPTGSGGGTVPVWRGVLSPPTRLRFNVVAGTQIPLTAEGVLSAVLDNPLITPAGTPGPEDTAIELPWRLVIAPHSRSIAGAVVCRHSTRLMSSAPSGLWRTRLVDSMGAGLNLTVIDPTAAGAADPAFGPNNSLPLARADRVRLVTETATQAAPLKRLELSTLGGTLEVGAKFPNFEWEHRAVLGRDIHVRTLAKGAMYPTGHRAEFLQVAERIHDAVAGGAAVLRSVKVLTIVDPIRHAPADGPVARSFPMGDVEIVRTVFSDLASPDWQTTELPGVGPKETHFWPTTRTGAKVAFSLACTTANGAVHLDLPLIFVADLRPNVDTLASPVLAHRLGTDYGSIQVSIPPTNIDLVGVATVARASGDMHEVHALTLAGVVESLDLADGYRPRLDQLEIALPALRALRGDDVRTSVRFGRNYLAHGAGEDVLLEMVQSAVPIDFSKAADRSGGLVAPKYVTNALSRTLGPIDLSSRPDPGTGLIDPRRLFPTDEASLLGFPLRLLLTQLKLPPQMTATPSTGSAPEVRMRWENVRLRSVGPFTAGPSTTLTLTVTTAPSKADTECLLQNFALELPPGPTAVLRLSFAMMKFLQHEGKSPRLDVDGVEAAFLGDLKLIEKLQDAVDLGGAGKFLDVRPTGITVHYAFMAPEIASGAFVMRNIAFSAGIDVPFDGRPVSIVLGFASRANPFLLSVNMFGGGGYVELAINPDGLTRVEAALEFGAFVAVDFVVASGEVHALGGARFVLDRGQVTVTGYLRVGGCIEVLGLISVSIELCLFLSYQPQRNALVGRATLVIEIDLTLWSERVEIDSGEWKLGGGDRRLALSAADGLSLWRRYQAAFAADDERAVAVARGLRGYEEEQR